MSSDSSAIVSGIDSDDWDDGDHGDDNVALADCPDNRRRVEKKLEDLRLRRETSEFDFDG